MYIAIDFDGTVVTTAFPNVGEDLPHCVDVLRRLQKFGHKLILLTNREHVLYSGHDVLQEALDWFSSRQINLYSVNSNPESQLKYHIGRKVYSDIYIDDHGLGIPLDSRGNVNWFEVEQLLLSRGVFSGQLEFSF